MLHLLDPRVYRLGDQEAFRERVRKRQDIGHVLLSLQEGTPSFLLRTSIEQLRNVFPEDEALTQLADDLRSAIALVSSGWCVRRPDNSRNPDSHQRNLSPTPANASKPTRDSRS